MQTVEIIFSQKHTALRDSGGFTKGQEIKEVKFEVTKLLKEPQGLSIQFDPQGALYFYPWHTIDRLKTY